MALNGESIVIRGAREHNLRNVHVDLPKNSLIVLTGVSGSGKSSLAFDTLYAEGQRRYVESLSSYARQFLGQLPKPDVDYLGGLSPAISIQQKSAIHNPRSTVGTITEIHDFLRVLYARLGQGHCPDCGLPITSQSRDQIIDRILALPEGSRILVLAPVVRSQKGEFKDFFSSMLKRGFVRARVDGRLVRLADDHRLDKRLKHNIDIVIDRLTVGGRQRSRIAEAVEQALALADDSVIIAVETPRSQDAGEGGYEDFLLSARYACLKCNKSFEPPSPQLFSFNSPLGMCLDCEGLGTQYTFDPRLLVPDPSISFYDGAVTLVGPVRSMGRWRRHIFEGVARDFGMDLKKPWGEMPESHRNVLLYGAGDRVIVFEWKQRGGGIWRHGGKWEGIVPQLMTSFKKTGSGPRRWQLERYMRVARCPSCQGQRLNPQARNVRLAGWTLIETEAATIQTLADRFTPQGPIDKALTDVQRQIAAELLKEIRVRLQFLLDVGLHYLTLDRPAPTLSGGEAQRIRLAGQIGSGLVGVLYILDEPSIGLHPRDNDRLLKSLQRLRDMGNTVVVVEHDEDTIRLADYVVDFGPGPGVRGGEIVATGRPAEIMAHPRSLTGQYLAGIQRIDIPKHRRMGNGQFLKVLGARHHNLKNIQVEIPLGRFVCVTGVSGSGKSSLVNDVLLTGVRRHFGGTEEERTDEEGEDGKTFWHESEIDFDGIEGIEAIDKVIAIDQSPIGRTPRSNPATYIKVFDEIRALYAQMADAKVRGYSPGRFSFNRPGGRCEACEGNGSHRLEMDFLADIWVTCPVCEGRRFNRETLQVRYRGKSIHDVLEMDVQQALQHFEHMPKIRAMLQTLHDVGLDYIKLGQPSPTLSGGEAQRIKLARELCRRNAGKTLYILDEPTTGLHFDDIRRLLAVLHNFVDAGNTVVVIEHNLDVIKTADWVIDLGPEGGAEGGEVVAVGTPEVIARHPNSHTGKALASILNGSPALPPPLTTKKSKSLRRAHRITHIEVRGAREHNLKDVDAQIPREAMTVCCGPSGSGKSSLAIDTLYAEGQRRYVESLSSYARQFLGQVQKPKVEQITGLSPAISIEQKTTSKSPRSTVGTVTEIYDYLRVLFARLGQYYCPQCHLPVGTQTADEIIDKILALPEGTKLYLLAPIESRRHDEFEAIREEIRRFGFVRVRVDGRTYALDEVPPIDRRRKHEVEIVIDRITVSGSRRSRIADAVEQALQMGKGVMRVAYVDSSLDEKLWRVERFSQHLACGQCGRGFEPLNPHHFSFNSPLGWCPNCEGLGTQQGANLNLLIRDPMRSLREGALSAWPDLTPENPFTAFAEALAHFVGFSLDQPFNTLPPAHQHALLHGTGDRWIPLLRSDDGARPRRTRPSSGSHNEEQVGTRGIRFQYKGVFPAIDEAVRRSVVYRQKLEHLVSEVPCRSCQGSRLRDDAGAVQFHGRTLHAIGTMTLDEALLWIESLQLTDHERHVASELLREIKNRLRFLVDVGLEYLTLDRPTPTLSGGEAQRIRLASQIGSGLSGVLYVLDEPTIGLHPRDNQRLIRALQQLRDLGNTLVIVEHDREVIASADYLLDFGPGAGDRGGEIVAAGTTRQIVKSKKSLTGAYLAGRRAIPVPSNRRIPSGKSLEELSWPRLIVRGARHHNLKNLDVAFPLGALIAVTGVSGSGKSSLVNDVLANTLARKLHRLRAPGAAHDRIDGWEHLDKIIIVDQEPIGNSPSSNPATYTGAFDLIRELFAQLPDAKVRGYPASRFSFNRKGGRCETCEGNGLKRIEMHFLPDIWVECEVCRGTRYNQETLAVRYQGRSIADVLQMRVAEALDLFSQIPKIRRILQTLADVGLDYIQLGQPAPTLSGGESQRVKLAAELARSSTGKTLYVLDEPTTGLHFDDVKKLVDVLHRLVDHGNTVIVVEHNLDVIKTADWVIELGPEAGHQGGHLVAAGTPEKIAVVPESRTAPYLREALRAGPLQERQAYVMNTDVLREGDVDIADIGREVRLPWEVDPIRWHTQDRVTTRGRPARWDGSILLWLDEQLRQFEELGEPNWNHRTIVEFPARKRSYGWFLHALTGFEWYLRLVFRVARNTFRQTDLAEQLTLTPFDQIQGVTYFHREPRVQVCNRRGPWQEVVILAYQRAELDTPAFQQFLRSAVNAFRQNLNRMQTRPEDVMPWKVNGERWHFSEKGFPPGRKIRWDRTLLPRLVRLVSEAVAEVEIRWDSRDAIAFYLRGIPKMWSRWRTKDEKGLDLCFFGPPGITNLQEIEKFGASQRIDRVREVDQTQVVRLVFANDSHLPAEQFQKWLREHATKFRQCFTS
jgi:excinuclease ABC subunit A